MSKKMKGVAFDPSSPYGSYQDHRARAKHQTLLKEFNQLFKETEAKRKKLEAMKQRKLTLLAEVRFLRRRHKFLLNNRSHNLPQDHVKPQHVETLRNKSKKVQAGTKKETTARNLLPPVYPKQKGRIQMKKSNIIPSLNPAYELNHYTSHNTNEVALQRGIEASDISQSVRTYREREMSLPKSAPVAFVGEVPTNSAPVFDLNQNASYFSSNEATIQSRAPVFDLNQVSREEESQENCEQSLDAKKVLSRSSFDGQQNNLMASLYRNIPDGSTSRPLKRKISWQDPVALIV